MGRHGDIIAESVRLERIHRLRSQNPPVPIEQSPIPGCSDGPRHRFFYFDDYMDLAEQLAKAGWIDAEQLDGIMRSFGIDHAPEPMREVLRCDYLALWATLRARRSGLSEADEAERASFEYAERALPTVARAHLRLAQPSQQVTGIVLQICSVQLLDIFWPDDGA